MTSDPQGTARLGLTELRAMVEQLFRCDAPDPEATRLVVQALRAALADGSVRAAEPDEGSPTGWRVNAWVKQGILLAFRVGRLEPVSWPAGSSASPAAAGRTASFADKDTLPVASPDTGRGVRIVPGGSAVRDGAYLGRRVVCMPPMYINIGAYVDDDSLVDSHALVGSCAQVGKRVHLSAAAQVGGVIEPVGALPVIVEDEVLVGGNCGVYEGAIVRRRAVLASGTVITGSTPIYDLVRGEIIAPGEGRPVIVPEGAVVVPGARQVTREPGRSWGLSLATPVIVKYRDERTDARVELERWIR
jgi:2,3,4,5-tetrahydropyridine-2-carboxylate N-succinyltransferase